MNTNSFSIKCLIFVSQSLQPPPMYQYTMSTINQGKYPRTKGKCIINLLTVVFCWNWIYWKYFVFSCQLFSIWLGSVVAQRSDHGTAAPPMLQAAASAAGAPLVASPYAQSYLQYNPQQYGQQQVLQAMTPYPGQVGALCINNCKNGHF